MAFYGNGPVRRTETVVAGISIEQVSHFQYLGCDGRDDDINNTSVVPINLWY